jgi:uncharacterized membrane protein YfcA
MDLWLAVAGLGVGIVVGLTGMGGGALMTPIVVMIFGVPPTAAVASDLVVSAIMKPVGSAVHMRRGTVHHGIVKWLCVGSVPSAFAGVLATRALGGHAQDVVGRALGAALLLAAIGLVARGYLSLRDRTGHGRADRVSDAETEHVAVRPLATMLIGAAGGFIVGITSVGSGSLIIIALLAVYPMLRANNLVGTDLVQAVPLVVSAAIAHLIFGDFRLAVAAPLAIGSIPGVYIGARISSRANSRMIRPILGTILVASGLRQLKVPDLITLGAVAAIIVLGPLVWAVVRRQYGLPAWFRKPIESSEVAAEGTVAPAETH